jgi:L-lactate dehydrogenase complex protein LldG
MNNTARERIFNRLTAASRASFYVPRPVPLTIAPKSQSEKVQMLKARQEAVKSQVHVVKKGQWIQALKSIVTARQVKTLVYAPETPIGKDAAAAYQGSAEPALIPYVEEIENFKDTLFRADAGITSTRGGIAETGALILWPDAREPRLLSLVPSIHIAVLDADTIYDTFNQVMEKEAWAGNMPTNAILISGPSKTADIELVLAFGVHGPKELVIIIRED